MFFFYLRNTPSQEGKTSSVINSLHLSFGSFFFLETGNKDLIPGLGFRAAKSKLTLYWAGNATAPLSPGWGRGLTTTAQFSSIFSVFSLMATFIGAATAEVKEFL